MKRALGAATAVLLLGLAAARLTVRWREEKADHRITMMADWSEVRDNAARQNISDQDLLERLHQAGFNALLVGAATVQDYLWQDMAFASRPMADTVLHQLQDRGVTGVSLESSHGFFRLMGSASRWQRLKDVEVGFNPELLGKASQAGLRLVLRINNDPWLDKTKLFSDLETISTANSEMAILLNTDEVPGGADALPAWMSFLQDRHYAQLLFEFHPAKSSVKLALRAPLLSYRAHTIPSAELKDLLPAQQLSRWHRAVEERSCRFLLLHLSPCDSLPSFLENAFALEQYFTRSGWTISWPNSHVEWSMPSGLERLIAPLVSLLLAIAVPILALRINLREKPGTAYVRIVLLTFIGACLVAAVAQNPWTRLEIIPFRGIKVAFLLAWAGSFASLYSWKEIKTELSHSVRRLDVVVGLGAAGVLAYLLLRSGNAGSGWKVGWEQGVRDHLENWLIARPRFKEFAIGYPLLLVGLCSLTRPPGTLSRIAGEGKVRDLPSPAMREKVAAGRMRVSRFLIGLGMIGPISMVNTFCHLHSPLYLAVWRSLNGFALGTVIGILLLAGVNYGMVRSER